MVYYIPYSKPKLCRNRKMTDKILVLRPLKSIVDIAKELSESLGVECKIIYCESNQIAIEWAKKYFTEGYHIVVSRGGMAKAIADEVEIKTIEIPIDHSDLSAAIEKARKIGHNVGILINSRIEHLIAELKQIHHISIKKLEVPAGGNFIDTMLEAKSREHIDVIVGGVAPCRIAETLNMKYCIVGSGYASVRIALLKAKQLQKTNREESKTTDFFPFIETYPSGTIFADIDGEIIFCNEEFKRLVGLEKEQLIGLPVQRVFPEFNLENLTDTIKPAMSMVTIQNRSLFQYSKLVKQDDICIGSLTIIQTPQKLKESAEIPKESEPQEKTSARFHFSDFETVNPKMKQIIRNARLISGVDSTVLITGETGTGKEMFAQSIHNASQREKKPFFAINCASIPDTILESELFGYEEGAFTGARRGGRKGYFEIAEGGTIFLDEIGELSPKMQSKLLRVLQQREIIRLGGENVIPINVRIIAATLVDLREKIETGSFRADLYYRLNIIRIQLPPLRDRLEDIQVLTDNLSGKIAHRLALPKPNFPSLWMEQFKTYSWPGNVRELSNIIERLTIKNATETLTAGDINMFFQELQEEERSGYVQAKPDRSPLQVRNLEEVELEYIQEVLAKNNGNKKATCEQLGISQATLWRKLSKPNISK